MTSDDEKKAAPVSEAEKRDGAVKYEADQLRRQADDLEMAPWAKEVAESWLSGEGKVTERSLAKLLTKAYGDGLREAPKQQGQRDAPASSLNNKPLLYGKHCRGPGCDDFNEQCPSCACACDACTKPRTNEARLGCFCAGCSRSISGSADAAWHYQDRAWCEPCWEKMHETESRTDKALLPAWFVRAMEQKLADNVHNGGWQKDPPHHLLARVIEETAELVDVLMPDEKARSEFNMAIEYLGNAAAKLRVFEPYLECRGRPHEVRNEAADIANMAMMVADVMRKEPAQCAETASPEGKKQ
jgi:hypothetical protein